MLIERMHPDLPTPFGGAGRHLTGTAVVESRSSERSSTGTWAFVAINILPLVG